MAKPNEPLTEENRDEHYASVPGIFGDTPTAGVDPADNVPTKDQTAASENLAALEADDDQDASPVEAVRQADAVGSGTTAEEVDEAAPERDKNDRSLFGRAPTTDAPTLSDATGSKDDEDEDEDDDDDNKTAVEVVSEIEDAESVEEVDALAEGDERVTVQRAADKRKEELS